MCALPGTRGSVTYPGSRSWWWGARIWTDSTAGACTHDIVEYKWLDENFYFLFIYFFSSFFLIFYFFYLFFYSSNFIFKLYIIVLKKFISLTYSWFSVVLKWFGDYIHPLSYSFPLRFITRILNIFPCTI